MGLRFLFLASGILLFSGCQDDAKQLNDLNSIKREFIQSIFEENFDESPFSINYSLRTVFFSADLISLFGNIFVYNHLPHGWSNYEGKTFYKTNGKFEEITLKDLFTTPEQQEFLRIYCESSLKRETSSYFSGKNALTATLDPQLIQTFVVDDQFLIIIFQPYSVGGGSDGPVHVKIPYMDLQGKWNPKNPLIPILNKVLLSKEFTSSWDKEEFYSRLEDEASRS